MREFKTEIYLDGLKFTEGLRWHDNQLWFCDLWAKKVYRSDSKDLYISIIELNDEPVGLGWLADGTLLITSLFKRQLLAFKNNILSIYKDLGISTPGYCHDFTISNNNYIYLSASGFYPSYKVKPVTSSILMITPDKELRVAATDVGYPNGIILCDQDKKLIVAETFSARIISFDINENHELVNRRELIAFDQKGFYVDFDKNSAPRDLERHYPDGISYHQDKGELWVASPGKKEVLCIDSKGKIIKVVHTISMPFDCALGGANQDILFIASSDLKKDIDTGKIEYTKLRP
ncbi:TPA: SMP-30/gluconolactonase/LRE family protein [Legionella pneumophila]|nr:hypothetical protein [Legionella pneumophila]HAU1321148.1 SMP-30/gluconolactonase/LRE family protein [Legionella pneumophila]HBD9374573.1 SMP-30/gluconolactonase/LRE family protein [Legionella pneumophila]HBI2946775.1 SMP-30/gluconolactonase/LRE family protein [Legionella pneumophila]HDV6631541.1 SMP-30/gluconolactonase/LRE family protein [Legionella pneumophila]